MRIRNPVGGGGGASPFLIDRRKVALKCTVPQPWLRVVLICTVHNSVPDPPQFGKLNPDPPQFVKLDPDPHQSGKLDPDPESASK